MTSVKLVPKNILQALYVIIIDQIFYVIKFGTKMFYTGFTLVEQIVKNSRVICNKA